MWYNLTQLHTRHGGPLMALPENGANNILTTQRYVLNATSARTRDGNTLEKYYYMQCTLCPSKEQNEKTGKS